MFTCLFFAKRQPKQNKTKQQAKNYQNKTSKKKKQKKNNEKNPRVLTNVLTNDKLFLFPIRHPPCHSLSSPVKVLLVIDQSKTYLFFAISFVCKF